MLLCRKYELAAGSVVTSATATHLPSRPAQCSIPLPVSRKRCGSRCRRYRRRRHARTQLIITRDDEFPRNVARVSCTLTPLVTTAVSYAFLLYLISCNLQRVFCQRQHACNRQPVYSIICTVHVFIILPNLLLSFIQYFYCAMLDNATAITVQVQYYLIGHIVCSRLCDRSNSNTVDDIELLCLYSRFVDSVIV